MHCLYCDRPLALLTRLTGDGEFCSKEHRRIYQREHNQLALERLLETQPAGNRRASERPRRGSAPPEPVETVEPVEEPVETVEPVESAPETPPERLPDLAEFQAEYPLGAEVDFSVLRLTGDPLVIASAPIWAVPDAARESGRSAQPKAAVFQSESAEPRAFGDAVRWPEVFNFAAKAHPRLRSDESSPPAPAARLFSCAGFVFPATAGAPAPAGRTAFPAVEPRWKALEPVLAGAVVGRIVYITGSFLDRPLRPAPLQDGLPEIYEIRLQPLSFPPHPPRMACLEERLHRTDRIGFCPP